ncbi:hypothetical protein INT45_004930 [Circinella minor]|uniref:Uncharacterized protein n=1 Tax=Circinella minor TaxID=1195481 RepID=A0A8H7VR73_9FUNG|nr:hypothetical protein INT45_004930 [Circinella minor]
MPIVTTGSLLALGAAGVAGAAVYKNRNHPTRRNSQQDVGDTSPYTYGRRQFGSMQNDGYDPSKQAELFWRRNNGINFSHNADKKFPI